MRTVIISDNQSITKLGLLYICKQLQNIDIIDNVPKKQVLIEALSTHPSAVVIIDYTLFDLVSVEELLILQERFRESDWLLFSDTLSEYFIKRVISNKKISIVLKEDTAEEIQRAINSAINSQQYICRELHNIIKSNTQDELKNEKAALTTTEKEILKLIALGKTTKEIATERFSSVNTVATHRKNIFRKLDVNNVYEATKYALRAGIIDEAEYYI